MNRISPHTARIITAILIAGLLASGIADAMPCCCGGLPAAPASSGGGSDDGRCHAAPPTCGSAAPEAAGCPESPGADDGAGAACCGSDPCDAVPSVEILQNSSPPSPLLPHGPSGAPDDAFGAVPGLLKPDLRTAIPQPVPIYRLKNAILC